jgi:hydrogenase expression/formation protein HypE
LAVSGSVNDLAVSGAIPKFLSAGFILEEGFSLQDLEKIVKSMAAEAVNADIKIVTGDTKVVNRGQCDKIFINTSGIGILPVERQHLKDKDTISPGDKIIVSGTLGDHAIAILAARENLNLDEKIISDAAPLNHLIEAALDDPGDIRMMRDITRGGLATVLVEICEDQSFGIFINEKDIPVRRSVRSICELYGFDPLYLANEGKIVLVVKAGSESGILEKLKANALGKEASIIGEITDDAGSTIMQSGIGGKRIIDMLSGEMLPRIC